MQAAVLGELPATCVVRDMRSHRSRGPIGVAVPSPRWGRVTGSRTHPRGGGGGTRTHNLGLKRPDETCKECTEIAHSGQSVGPLAPACLGPSTGGLRGPFVLSAALAALASAGLPPDALALAVEALLRTARASATDRTHVRPRPASSGVRRVAPTTAARLRGPGAVPWPSRRVAVAGRGVTCRPPARGSWRSRTTLDCQRGHAEDHKEDEGQTLTDGGAHGGSLPDPAMARRPT